MQLLALLGTAAFVVVGAVVGARLLLLSRRTGELPERLVGAGLFVHSVVTQPSSVAGQPLGRLFGFDATLLLVAVSLVGVVLTLACVNSFTWIVFQHRSKLALAAAITIPTSAALAGFPLMRAIAAAGLGAEYGTQTKLWLGLIVAGFSVTMAWTAVESFRYRTRLRKRLALGLTDPVVVNRFGLWGFGCAACSAMTLLIVFFVSLGFNIATHPAPMLTSTISGMTVALCWYLSFLPPQRYLDWIRDRAPAPVA